MGRSKFDFKAINPKQAKRQDINVTFFINEIFLFEVIFKVKSKN